MTARRAASSTVFDCSASSPTRLMLLRGVVDIHQGQQRSRQGLQLQRFWFDLSSLSCRIDLPLEEFWEFRAASDLRGDRGSGRGADDSICALQIDALLAQSVQQARHPRNPGDAAAAQDQAAGARRRPLDRAHWIRYPPSTASVWPLIAKPAPGEHNQTTALAISSSSPQRFIGLEAATKSCMASGNRRCDRSV